MHQHNLKNSTRCYSFDQSVRKCNDRVVVNMKTKYGIVFSDRVVLLLLFYVVLLLCETSCPPQQQVKSRVYPLRCQDSGPQTRSYTAAAAAAGVAVQCCCRCGLGTRTHTKTVPLTSGWRVYIPRRGTHQAGCAACRP